MKQKYNKSTKSFYPSIETIMIKSQWLYPSFPILLLYPHNESFLRGGATSNQHLNLNIPFSINPLVRMSIFKILLAKMLNVFWQQIVMNEARCKALTILCSRNIYQSSQISLVFTQPWPHKTWINLLKKTQPLKHDSQCSIPLSAHARLVKIFHYFQRITFMNSLFLISSPPTPHTP